ncbi:HEPN domain-containing protein [Pantoea stewartii]|uniref:ApeA N-terminal domain 1-containing protein n=1 Tax=Pantoea stewartii TaxID=66269 RepID=UPI0019800959|nr:HEPN domain-containing protein [Pantoea stewartii]
MGGENENLFHEKHIEVQIFIEDVSYPGALSFDGTRFPKLQLKNLYSREGLTFLKYLKGKSELTCISVKDKRKYTMHGVKDNDDFFSAEYIAEGEPLIDYNKMTVNISGFSVWLDGMRNYSANSEIIEKSNKACLFAEKFSSQGKNYTLSIYLGQGNQENDTDNGRDYFEPALEIIKEEGSFTFEECRFLSHQLRNLFSILTGRPLSVKNVWVSDTGSSGSFINLHFPLVIYSESPLQYPNQALTDFAYLLERDKLSIAINNFFTNNNFRKIWNRIIPSYEQVGVWEYDILSRVIILEMYASIKTKEKKLSISDSLNGKLKEKLKQAIMEFESETGIEGDELIVLRGMARSILATKNTSLPTLKEKYEELLRILPSTLINVISISDDDFKRIKRLRDSIAHGNSYSTHSGDIDISHEIQLNDRLLVLLICFVYFELGFDEIDIIHFLRCSFCHFINSSGINKRELDRLSGEVDFLKLTSPPKNNTLSSPAMIVVNHTVENDQWFINEEATKKLRTEWVRSGIDHSQEYVKSITPDKQNQTFELKQRAYIENDGQEKEHYIVVIIHS